MQWTSAPNIGEAPLPQRARSYWKTRFSALHEGLEKLLEAERAQLPPWVVVGFGSGIAAWFALDAAAAMGRLSCASAAALALVGLRARRAAGRRGRSAGSRSRRRSAARWCGRGPHGSPQPRLSRPVVAEVAGTCRDGRSSRGQGDRATDCRAVPTPALPPLVRISIDEDKFPAGIAPGAEIRGQRPARAAAADGAARDLRFRARRLVPGHRRRRQGARRGQRSNDPRQPHGLDRARSGLRQHISQRLPASSAGIAIALATGDQNAVDEDDADAMRRSGLTHLLSVSGLHIAAVVAFACSSASSCWR